MGYTKQEILMKNGSLVITSEREYDDNNHLILLVNRQDDGRMVCRENYEDGTPRNSCGYNPKFPLHIEDVSIYTKLSACVYYDFAGHLVETRSLTEDAYIRTIFHNNGNFEEQFCYKKINNQWQNHNEAGPASVFYDEEGAVIKEKYYLNGVEVPQFSTNQIVIKPREKACDFCGKINDIGVPCWNCERIVK